MMNIYKLDDYSAYGASMSGGDKMDSLNGVTLVILYIFSLITLPAIGLLLGKLMTFICGYLLDYTQIFYKALIEKNSFLAWNVTDQNISVANVASAMGLKVFYLVCLLVCVPVLLMMLLAAAFAFFAPLVGFLAVAWNGAPVDELLLVIGSGILCLAYIATVCIAVYRYSE